MAERVLMIDDDSRLAGMVSDYLGGAGFRVTIAGTAHDGEALLKRETFDAVILDLMLPDADGLDLCRGMRLKSDIPVLMLTARGDPLDRVVGLEIDLGAREVRLDGQRKTITGHQFTLLVALAERAGRVLSRDALMDLTRG